MSWIDHMVWWHVYPLGMCGAPIRPPFGADASAHRITMLENWLDYLIELGANGLLLGPIFQSTSHGYDILDHFAVDPRLGDEADFDHLIAACHERGIRVACDGVFSHVSSRHPLVSEVLAAGPDSEHAELFDIDWEDPAGPTPRIFEGHGELVRLNHAGAQARAYATDVMTYWLERGIDAWRLDAAYSVPSDFWRDVIDPVRARFPEAWLMGEVIHGDYNDMIEQCHFDSLTQYELWKAIWSSISDRNFFELQWCLDRHNHFLDSFTPQTFIGNHDVTRIASQIGSQHVGVALAIVMTVGGIPSIYYGDEQGYTGIKTEELGGDDQVRPSFPDLPDHLSNLGESVFQTHQALIALRRQHPWLVHARTQVCEVTNEQLSYRSSADGHTICVFLDLHDSDAPHVTITEPGGQILFAF